MRKTAWVQIVGWATLMMMTAGVQATTFPTQPVRLIVPFGAGGITDLVARLLAQQLGKELGQTVIVENKAGAGGMIAAQAAQNAKADGYTVFMGTVGTQVVNPLILPKISYDPQAFVPIGMVTGSPYVLAVRSDLGVDSYTQLVAHARQVPGQLNFGSAGIGSSPHLGVELFKLTEQVDVRHIPFKSGGEAVSAVVGSHSDMVMDAIPVIMPQVRAGKLHALVLADSQRSSAAPEVPSSTELGSPELRISSWNVLLAPPGTSPEVVAVLETALQKTLAHPEFKTHLEQQGSQVYTGTQDEYQSFIAAERSKWQRIVQTAEISLE